MIVDYLEDTGIVVLAPMQGAREMIKFLEGCPTHHGHVKGASVAAHQQGNSSCWSAEDVLRAPHFFEFALSLMPLAKEYLGQDPLLYSVNAFTTYPISGPMNPDIQEWHRDRDDTKFLALFVYLTDVLTLDDGAHLYQRGTHNGTAHGMEMRVLGPAGTAFFADGRGMHMGVRPLARPRTMAWARWGVSDPPASYLWDQQSPASRDILGSRYPEDKDVQRMIRLVVR